MLLGVGQRRRRRAVTCNGNKMRYERNFVQQQQLCLLPSLLVGRLLTT